MLGLTLNYKQLKIIHQIRAESQSCIWRTCRLQTMDIGIPGNKNTNIAAAPDMFYT
ncbi:hypothetical protein DPMN_040491 [Dreissena polymorpha]|uniref:Uncharacterized protein n=1 Tax=Dreissena polymorpha TaxID=45954 RepID=A0A9D4CX03_DREPO|nr:hypothetical protein DPMN_040491 [Dreissena polymorpha]